MRDSLDRYYTPPDLARQLVALLPIETPALVLEPSVGAGAFVQALPRGVAVLTMDIDPAAPANPALVMDFEDFTGNGLPIEWVIGNPPYSRALEHTRHALSMSRHVAFLMRLGFLESRKRAAFWQAAPLRKIWALSERPSFTGGKTDSYGYGFFWFDREHSGPATLEVFSWR